MEGYLLRAGRLPEYRVAAHAEGVSLAAWIRGACDDRLSELSDMPVLAADLDVDDARVPPALAVYPAASAPKRGTTEMMRAAPKLPGPSLDGEKKNYRPDFK